MADKAINGNGKKKTPFMSFLHIVKDITVIVGIVSLLLIFAELKIDVGILKGRFQDMECTMKEILKLHPRTTGGIYDTRVSEPHPESTISAGEQHN